MCLVMGEWWPPRLHAVRGRESVSDLGEEVYFGRARRRTETWGIAAPVAIAACLFYVVDDDKHVVRVSGVEALTTAGRQRCAVMGCG